MSYGVEVFTANGMKVISMADQGVIFEECWMFPASDTTLTRSYPKWTGRTGLAVAFDLFWSDKIITTWSYANGYPELTVQRSAMSPGAAASRTDLPIYIFVQ